MPSTKLRPTPEQEEAVAAFQSGEDLKLVAVAGSGKTTTLRLMAEATPKRRLLYLAFNRSVREEGQRRMPGNVVVLTLHGLAYREVVAPDPALRAKVAASGGQLRAGQVYEALEGQVSRLGAYVVRATLENFLRSPLERPTPAMLPPHYRELLRRKGREGELEAVLGWVEELWRRMADRKDPFPLPHDGYAKLWALSGPRLAGVDALLVDEAQDLDPLFAGVLERQEGVQRVYVGDSAQQIYAWRGAVNAMEALGGRTLGLTWSFRFGEGLAGWVRGLMRAVGRSIPLLGKAPWPTEVGGRPRPPFTVLCRTNAGVVDAVARLRPKKAHILGGVDELVALLQDAEALRRGEPRERPHPDLALVESWEELEVLAKEVGDPSARVLLALAEEYTDLRALGLLLFRVHTTGEAQAEVVFSTAHRAKGREWGEVVLWEDFPPVWEEAHRRQLAEALGEGEARAHLWEEENLLYVAATRARHRLVPPPDLQGRPLWAPPSQGVASHLTRPPAPTSPADLSLAAQLLAFLSKVAADERVPEDLRQEGLALTERALGALGFPLKGEG